MPGFADHRQLIDSVRPDVVHICTPHDQHVQVAIDCLERGVHVITEKPLAHTVKDGQRLIEAADREPRQDRRLLPEPLQRRRCGDAPAADLG